PSGSASEQTDLVPVSQSRGRRSCKVSSGPAWTRMGQPRRCTPTPWQAACGPRSGPALIPVEINSGSVHRLTRWADPLRTEPVSRGQRGCGTSPLYRSPVQPRQRGSGLESGSRSRGPGPEGDPDLGLRAVERVKGIEPSLSAWE